MGGAGHAANFLLHLLNEKLNLVHSLHVDNFYNGYAQAKQLLDAKLYCAGTLRSKRKNNPKELEDKKLQRRETVCGYSNGVMIGKWRDKIKVLYILTKKYKNQNL